MIGKGTVLVVDDDPFILDFLQMALEDEGYKVVVSVDGAAALQVVDRLPPDVILLDIMMPVMDGVEVSRRLRANPRTASIPIIVMSARDSLRATEAVMPVDDRLPKPFHITDLYAAVARWMGAAEGSAPS